MYLRAKIWDPATEEIFEIENVYDPDNGACMEAQHYPELIEKIKELAVFEIDLTRGSPPSEEDTYLWVQVIIAQTREELAEKNAPYFRMNKLLYKPPGFKEKGREWIIISPKVILTGNEIKALYPERHVGPFYLTAMSSQPFSLEDEEDSESFVVFTDAEIDYSKEEGFDCPFNGFSFLNALDTLPSHLEFQNEKRTMVCKKSLLTVCFFLAEAVRFDLVQFAAMNMLNIYENAEDWRCLDSYQAWSNWREVVRGWSEICEKLQGLPSKYLDAALFSGVPVYHGIISFQRKKFHAEEIIRTLTLIGNCKKEIYVKNQEAFRVLEDGVLLDFFTSVRLNRLANR